MSNLEQLKSLDTDSQRVISTFTLLWSFVENRMFNSDFKPLKVKDWLTDDLILKIEELEPVTESTFDYFRERYVSEGSPTTYFDGVFGKDKKVEKITLSNLASDDLEIVKKFRTCMQVVNRFRCNLFHGPKWEENLIEQIENLRTANKFLTILAENTEKLRC